MSCRCLSGPAGVIVLFKPSVSLLTFSLVVLSIIESRELKTPTIAIELSISLFIFVFFASCILVFCYWVHVFFILKYFYIYFLLIIIEYSLFISSNIFVWTSVLSVVSVYSHSSFSVASTCILCFILFFDFNLFVFKSTVWLLSTIYSLIMIFWI